jgi:hypothetical protein
MIACACGCHEPRIEYNFYFESRVRCPVCDRRTLWHSNRWATTEEWEEMQKHEQRREDRLPEKHV